MVYIIKYNYYNCSRTQIKMCLYHSKKKKTMMNGKKNKKIYIQKFMYKKKNKPIPYKLLLRSIYIEYIVGITFIYSVTYE